MPPDPHILAADAILPMDDAHPQILRNAGIVIDGEKITAVAELADLRRQFGLLPVERLGGILLPGFVNAHTHLELSLLSADKLAQHADTPVWTSAILRTTAPQPPKRTTDHRFARWIQTLIAARPAPDQLDAYTRNAFRQGAAESLRAGVTALGDVSRYAPLTRSEALALLEPTPRVPRVVSFGEVLGIGAIRDRAVPLITAAGAAENFDSPAGFPLLRRAISPHAPYTVEGPVLRACLRAAIIKNLPIAVHLAETAAESQMLADLSGPLGREWEAVKDQNILDDQVPLLSGGPIRWAQRWGLLLADAHDSKPRRFPVLLAHVNVCDDSELNQLAASRASVAYCPRTHAYFQFPPHRYRDMLAAGINVCLATDSRASSPDLSPLHEARFLAHRDQFDFYQLLHMITSRAAAALGLADSLGTLSPGKAADLVLLPPSPDPDVLAHIFHPNTSVSSVYLAGQKLF